MRGLTIRGFWYTDPAGQYIVVVTGMPGQSVRLGLGTTVAEAWSSLETAAMQSVGSDSGEAAALRWAQHAGWIDDVEELEGTDARAASSVDSPIGELAWSDDAYGYVSAVYGAYGDQPDACYVRVGEDAVGLWWLDDGDGTVREAADGVPYNTEKEAREAAEALAAEQHEGEDGDLSRLVRAGDPGISAAAVSASILRYKA